MYVVPLYSTLIIRSYRKHSIMLSQDDAHPQERITSNRMTRDLNTILKIIGINQVHPAMSFWKMPKEFTKYVL